MDIVQCWDTNSVKIGTTDSVAKLSALECVFASILNIVIRLGGILAFIFLIIGGFNWLTSGGDPKKLQQAKNTITYAILGIILLIVAWLILLFIEKFTGVTVTNFNIKI